MFVKILGFIYGLFYIIFVISAEIDLNFPGYLGQLFS